MATEAEALLADASWLPEPLRTPGQPTQVETVAPDSTIAETLEDGGETTTADDDEARAATHAIAAE